MPPTTPFQVPEAQRKAIRTKLRGSAEDCAIACNVIEMMQTERPRVTLDYAIDDADDDHFVLYITNSLDMITGQQIEQLCRPRRVLDVRIMFAKRRVQVHISRFGVPLPDAVSAPKTSRKRRHVASDWAASAVSDADDQSNIDAIMHDVYTMQQRIPDMKFWFEPIVEGGAHLRGTPLPYTAEIADAAADASESDASLLAAVPEQQRVGYSLCFSNVPDMSGAFVRKLHASYGSLIVNCYAWLRPKPRVSACALFVVNLRRSLTSAGTATRTATAYVPHGINARKKRATSLSM